MRKLMARAQRQANTAMSEPLTVELAELRREVRASAAQASREATKLAGAGDYRTALRGVLESWIANGCARQKVVCFACAAEHRLLLHATYEEACRTVARESSALNALYWAALRRFGPLSYRNFQR
ncbi:hypothetical protein [Cupriavidus basilensis]|uniref:hypothetical protein n=1 Tax=Cupriavidus basilensis TaxID=68895 RepID=UPI00157A7A98|nr:hypothetical protein [Cupriavidus basilensis]NUA26917.1 hypothetical protein [Cupriavidus basilensis]